MVQYTPGQWVFISHSLHAYLPIKLTAVNTTQLIGTTQEGEHITVNPASCHIQPVTSAALHPVSNLVNLEELSEASILHNLRVRYSDDIIYTNTSSIVLSINPYKLLSCYGPSTITQYKSYYQSTANTTSTSPPPHIYALADAAYKQLLSDKKNQSILISGESGAGKTEATKLVLQYLADISTRHDTHSTAQHSTVTVEQQILQANPIIEAFGNAKTVRNNNSSRFGKWMNIIFDSTGHIASSTIESYLLEKSRVTSHALNERNYHIFYYLTQGCNADEKSRYSLCDVSEYRILSMGGLHTTDSTDVDNPMINNNAERLWNDVKQAMYTLNYTTQHIDCICRVLSFILHLSNVNFISDTSTDRVLIDNENSVVTACTVLGIDKSELIELLLTKTLMVSNKPIVTYMNIQQCADIRDSLCKSLYNQLFTYCIQLINTQLYVPVKHSMGSIGLLDIFGFENFTQNSFEQILINYTNEILQKYFTTQLFVLEQAEYRAEGVMTPTIEYSDNQLCIELIDQKNTGIIDMIAEEIRLPKGTDTNLLSRMHDTLVNNTHYIKPKQRGNTFSIRHYADTVIYTIDEFCNKNKDLVSDSLMALISTSTYTIISELYQSSVDINGNHNTGANTQRTGKQSVTLGKSFRTQVQQLLHSLSLTTSHFIRCIKPNHTKQPDSFDSSFVLKQLQYLGIKQVIQVRQAGYSVRKIHNEFYARYKILVDAHRLNVHDMKQSNQLIMCSVLDDQKLSGDWCIGINKVLMRQNIQHKLEALRELRIVTRVILIQCNVRGKLARLGYGRLRGAVQQLLQLIQIQSMELDSIDISLDQCIEYNAPNKIIQRGKIYRNAVYDHAQCQSALIHAIHAKDTQLLQSAITNGQVHCNESGWSIVELHQATTLLQRIQSYVRTMTSALQHRDLSVLQQCVAEGESIGLTSTQQYNDCCRLIQRLQQELQCVDRLQSALQSDAMITLQSAIQHASDIGLSKSNTVLVQCRAVVTQMELHQSLRSALQDAINTNDCESMNELIIQYNTNKFNDELYAEAILLCKQPLCSVSPQKAKATPAQQAESQKIKLITDYLSNAIESNDIDTLYNTIRHAMDSGVTDVKPFKTAQTLYNKLNDITELLNHAVLSNNLIELNTAISRAVDAGIIDTYQPLINARQHCAAVQRQQDDIHVLQDAIQLSDYNILLHASERCAHMSNTALYQQCMELLSQYKLQQQLRDRDIQSNVTLNHNSMIGKQTLKSGALSRRLSLTQDIAEWKCNVKYSIHLLPVLRSGDEYAKGKLLGKSKYKLTMLQWSKESIPRSLTRLSFNDHDQFNQLAIQLFKSIQGYMGDRAYTFVDTLAAELLQLGIQHTTLRDEIYVQCIKQLSNNPRVDSVLRGWQLLALISETFSPSLDTLPYIFKWLSLYTDIQNFNAKHYVQYTMKTLALNKPALSKPPFIQYITTFKDRVMSATFVTVYLPDQSTVQLMCDPTMHCIDVIVYVCSSLNLTQEQAVKFGLYQVTQPSNSVAVSTLPDLYIQHNEYILDYINTDTVLAFRLRMLSISDAIYNNTVVCSILYHQLMTDCLQNKYTLSRDVLLQIQALHEHLLDSTDRATGKQYDLAQYPVCTTPGSVIEFHSDVQNIYNTMNSHEIDPLRLLDIISSNCSTMGCYWFIVAQTEYKHIPNTLLLGINLHGVFVTHSSNRSILLQYTYKQINGWANNSSRFCIRVYDTQRQVEQYNFNTKQGSRIVQIIQDHVDCIMAQKLAAKQSQVSNNNLVNHARKLTLNTSILHTNLHSNGVVNKSVPYNGNTLDTAQNIAA